MAGNGRPWRARWWVIFTTIANWSAGIGIAVWETHGAGRTGVYGFCGFLIAVGSGLAGVEMLRRP